MPKYEHSCFRAPELGSRPAPRTRVASAHINDTQAIDDAFWKLTANIRRNAGRPGSEKCAEQLETAMHYVSSIEQGTGSGRAPLVNDCKLSKRR
jgi:hypothetical protein